MSRMQEIIKSLEAERGDVATRLSWLEKQIEEFKNHNDFPSGELAKLDKKPAKSKPRKPRKAPAPVNAEDIEVNVSDVVEDYLREHPGSTAGDIAEATGLKRSSLSTRLNTMTQKGQLRKLDRGYALPLERVA